ncbi:MAG TPA: hypothetical protein PLZ77_09655 [Lachnospiraceae bacterium]|nr:hypothetical protein [Lachnospiraceae bacterium]
MYENTYDAWANGQVPAEFLTVYRNEEYVRQHTKGMIPEETRKFAMDYYGWPDDEPIQQPNGAIMYHVALSPDEELPFQ